MTSDVDDVAFISNWNYLFSSNVSSMIKNIEAGKNKTVRIGVTVE